jgi:hypothetical protein
LQNLESKGFTPQRRKRGRGFRGRRLSTPGGAEEG